MHASHGKEYPILYMIRVNTLSDKVKVIVKMTTSSQIYLKDDYFLAKDAQLFIQICLYIILFI